MKKTTRDILKGPALIFAVFLAIPAAYAGDDDDIISLSLKDRGGPYLQKKKARFNPQQHPFAPESDANLDSPGETESEAND